MSWGIGGAARISARSVALRLGTRQIVGEGSGGSAANSIVTSRIVAAGGDCNLNGVTPDNRETPVTDVAKVQDRDGAELSAADEQLLRELTERARTGGLQLTGEGGLLGKLTKMVVEGALEGELDDHLGYSRNDPAGRNGGNSRNGHRAKTVLTEAGPVQPSLPRDRDSRFEPKIVAKRQRRLARGGGLVNSLAAKGLKHGEMAPHLAAVYGAEEVKQTISTIID